MSCFSPILAVSSIGVTVCVAELLYAFVRVSVVIMYIFTWCLPYCCIQHVGVSQHSSSALVPVYAGMCDAWQLGYVSIRVYRLLKVLLKSLNFYLQKEWPHHYLHHGAAVPVHHIRKALTPPRSSVTRTSSMKLWVFLVSSMKIRFVLCYCVNDNVHF